MVRTLIKIVLTIAGNAIGLSSRRAARRHGPQRRGFLIALLIFTVAELLIEPIVEKVFTKHAEKLGVDLARHDVPRAAGHRSGVRRARDRGRLHVGPRHGHRVAERCWQE